jgi:hypothetical protein
MNASGFQKGLDTMKTPPKKTGESRSNAAQLFERGQQIIGEGAEKQAATAPAAAPARVTNHLFTLTLTRQEKDHLLAALLHFQTYLLADRWLLDDSERSNRLTASSDEMWDMVNLRPDLTKKVYDKLSALEARMRQPVATTVGNLVELSSSSWREFRPSPDA